MVPLRRIGIRGLWTLVLLSRMRMLSFGVAELPKRKDSTLATRLRRTFVQPPCF